MDKNIMEDDKYMEDVYHCSSIELEKILKERGIEITNELLNKLIHKKYCFHIIKTKKGITKSCNRHRKYGMFCSRHTSTELKKGTFYCIYPDCKLHIDPKKNKYMLCGSHKRIMPSLPEPDLDEEMYFYNTIYSFFDNDIFSFYDIKVSQIDKKFDHIKKKFNFNFKFNNDFIYDYLKSKRKKVKFNDNIIKIIYENNYNNYNNDNEEIQKEQENIQDELPPLPIQTEDEKLLLSYNIVYETNNTIYDNLNKKDNYKNEIKKLKHDIYFLGKEKNMISMELNKYKKIYNSIVDFLNEKGFNNVLELENFIDIHIDNKCIQNNINLVENKLDVFDIKPTINSDIHNISTYKTMYKNILTQNFEINKDLYDLIIVLIHFIKIVLNLIDSKTLSIKIIIEFIDKIYFEKIKDYMNKNKKINFEDSIKITEFVCNTYNKSFYNNFFDSDGIKLGNRYNFEIK